MSGIVEAWKNVLLQTIKEAKTGPDEQTVKDYIFCTKQDARDWMASESEAPGSFIWVCELLELSPSAVRKEVFGGKG